MFIARSPGAMYKGACRTRDKPFGFVSEICCLLSYSAQTVLRRDPCFAWKGFVAVQTECRIGMLGSRAVPGLVLDEELLEHEV